MARITPRISEQLKKRLHRFAKREHVTVEMVVDEAIERFMDSREDWEQEDGSDAGWMNSWKERQRKKARS